MDLPAGPILVQLPSWLGDAVVASGLLEALACALPERALDVSGEAAALAVVHGHPAVRAALPAGRAAGGARGRWRVAGDLRARGYAASLTLPPSWFAACLARRIGAAVRVGFAGPGRRWLLTRPLRRAPRGTMHLGEEYRRLGAVLVPGLPPRRPRVALQAAARARAPGLAGSGDYLVLAPGAIYGPAKRYPVTCFAWLARRLAAGRGWRPVLVGADGDRPVCAALAAALGGAATDLAGRTSIAELAAVLAGARLVVANDSGPMHLAAAVGAPVIGVFGSTEPGWTAPLGGAAVQRDPPMPCAPCYLRRCSIGTPCLSELEPERVLAAAEALLAAGEPAAEASGGGGGRRRE